MNSQQQQDSTTMMQCAMNMGAVVGGYYIGKFCLFPLSLHSTLAAMLFLGLTLMVPFLIFRLAKFYRDRYCGGQIGFYQALAFSVLIMGFGSLLASVAHYVYFAFIDDGAMVEALEQSIGQLSAIDLNSLEGLEDVEATATQLGQYIELMNTTIAQVRAMTPIDMTIGMLSNNVSWAIVVALPVAAFVSLRKSQQGKS